MASLVAIIAKPTMSVIAARSSVPKPDLQRIWRDGHAAPSHISLNWDSTGTMYGQSLLGLEPKGRY